MALKKYQQPEIGEVKLLDIMLNYYYKLTVEQVCHMHPKLKDIIWLIICMQFYHLITCRNCNVIIQFEACVFPVGWGPPNLSLASSSTRSSRNCKRS